MLELADLGKRYRIRPDQSVILSLISRRRPVDFWALRHATLDVAPGEIVAIIGRNGAGKSTLLKLAAGVSRQTEGHIVRPRRVAPLIEVGAGFHPELSGRENVEINGRLLGMTQREVRSKFDQIVEFAELQRAIDRPVKEYSTGMYMRLGFAVAIHTEPELLIVDEVLAVGDLPFQARCMERISALRNQGTGVLFVSHNLSAVLEIADRAVLLVQGQQRLTGSTNDVVAAYHESLAAATGDAGEAATRARQALVVEAVTTRGLEGLNKPGDLVRLEIDVRAQEDIDGIIPGYRMSKRGVGLVAAWHGNAATALPGLHRGQTGRLAIDLALNVTDGTYDLDVAFGSPDWTEIWLECPRLISCSVAAPRGLSGLAYLGSRVELLPGAAASSPDVESG